MEKVKKILVALGFTEYSRETFDYAEALAECMGAELIVGSVINSKDVEAIGMVSAMGYEVDGDHYVEAIKKERQALFDGFLEKFPLSKERARAVFRVGHPIDELLKLIVEEKVDLVVMGVKGRSDLERVFVGSVAEKLFRKSPVPVLSFRDKKSSDRLRKRIPTG